MTIINRTFQLFFLVGKNRVSLFCVCVLAAISLFALPVSAEPLLSGIDRLESSGFRELSGLRVGLITNAAGISRKGEPNYSLMLRNSVRLKFLMAPEHGFSADIEAGKQVGGTVISDTLPVFSLYGASKKPAMKQLKAIDILVFDLQDVGTRCYTYISTMKNAMEACQEAGIAFMVLDRPNPVMPLHAEGFMVAPGYNSFVGAVNIPFIHAMTVGEIALLVKMQYCKKLDLRVIPMQGYRRDRFADEYEGFSFKSPSPNIRSVDAAIVYPATVFLEATVVSEGRGTDAPFMQFGAPFINSKELADALRRYRLPGVCFDTLSFQPRSGKFSGEHCNGIMLKLTDRKIFSPFTTATAILLELQRLYPDRMGLDLHGDFFDKLAGTPLLREMIRKQIPHAAIIDESRRQIELFRSTTSLPLLYH
ncbi:MAG: DUF1343 domain-containing protein [Chlorobiaceae bacterium]|nr:DUF1343 domain-containing protein [Chlorobiaceae bacterium]